MMYGAESRRLACAEMFSIAPRNAKGLLLSIGRSETQRPVQLLDLANLPSIPGFFSQEPHDDRIGLSFLHAFSEEIKKPVRRDGLAHIDYVPTQVFTEFMRDIKFATGRIDGILYRSSTGLSGANIVLFATQDDLSEGIRHLYCFSEKKDPWLRLESVKQLEARRADYPNSFLDKS
jgi:hypothetical protein